jgi:hypothetical protein
MTNIPFVICHCKTSRTFGPPSKLDVHETCSDTVYNLSENNTWPGFGKADSVLPTSNQLVEVFWFLTLCSVAVGTNVSGGAGVAQSVQ